MFISTHVNVDDINFVAALKCVYEVKTLCNNRVSFPNNVFIIANRACHDKIPHSTFASSRILRQDHENTSAQILKSNGENVCGNTTKTMLPLLGFETALYQGLSFYNLHMTVVQTNSFPNIVNKLGRLHYGVELISSLQLSTDFT